MEVTMMFLFKHTAVRKKNSLFPKFESVGNWIIWILVPLNTYKALSGRS